MISFLRYVFFTEQFGAKFYPLANHSVMFKAQKVTYWQQQVVAIPRQPLLKFQSSNHTGQ